MRRCAQNCPQEVYDHEVRFRVQYLLLEPCQPQSQGFRRVMGGISRGKIGGDLQREARSFISGYTELTQLLDSSGWFVDPVQGGCIEHGRCLLECLLVRRRWAATR